MRRQQRGIGPSSNAFPATEGTAQLLARYREKSAKNNNAVAQATASTVSRNELFGNSKGYQKIDEDVR